MFLNSWMPFLLCFYYLFYTIFGSAKYGFGVVYTGYGVLFIVTNCCLVHFGGA